MIIKAQNQSCYDNLGKKKYIRYHKVNHDIKERKEIFNHTIRYGKLNQSD